METAMRCLMDGAACLCTPESNCGTASGYAVGDWLAPTPSRDDELAALRAKVEELRATIRGMSSTIANQAQYISRMT